MTVTATVKGSVTLVLGPNGEQTLIVANVPAAEKEQFIAAIRSATTSTTASTSVPPPVHPRKPAKASGRLYTGKLNVSGKRKNPH
jgi:hypothetical protein